MIKLVNAKKKWILLLTILLLLGILLWYKWPVMVPVYDKNQMNLQLVYLDEKNTGTTTSPQIPKTDAQAQELFSMVSDVPFYKKLLQPYSVKSYSEPTGEIQLFIYAKQGERESPFILSVISDGTVRIKPNNTKESREYGIGLPGNREEKSLYEQLYQFYQKISTKNSKE